MGTSVGLKNKFAGYMVEVIVKQDYVRQMKDLVRDKLPGMSGGIVSLTFFSLSFLYLSNIFSHVRM